MTRGVARIIGRVLIDHAASNRYPTRSVEYLLTWFAIAWSIMVSLPHVVIPPSIAMFFQVLPAPYWTAGGLMMGAARLFALVRNGSWHRSPWLRMFGAVAGFNFWALISAFYLVGFFQGFPILPLHGLLPIVMFFELYSCFRCGQDAARVTAAVRSTDAQGHG